MTDPTAEQRAKDAEYEAVALPWLDDVYRFAVSLTRDPSNADDVVQETFLRAYRSWHTFQRGSDARKWLFTIARNVYLRSLERERRYVDIEDGDQDAMDAVVSRAQPAREEADAILSQIDLQPALRKALDELAEPYKSAVVLVDLEDQSYDEAAEVLGVPIGTVRSRLFRGRRMLQDKLVTYARDANFSSVQGPSSPATP